MGDLADLRCVVPPEAGLHFPPGGGGGSWTGAGGTGGTGDGTGGGGGTIPDMPLPHSPEPTTMALMAGGLVACEMIRRKRRK